MCLLTSQPVHGVSLAWNQQHQPGPHYQAYDMVLGSRQHAGGRIARRDSRINQFALQDARMLRRSTARQATSTGRIGMHGSRRRAAIRSGWLVLGALALGGVATAQAQTDWTTYGGTDWNQRWSTLKQINTQ